MATCVRGERGPFNSIASSVADDDDGGGESWWDVRRQIFVKPMSSKPAWAHPMTNSGKPVRRAPAEKFGTSEGSSSPPQCRRTKAGLLTAESTATANVFRRIIV